MVLGTLPDPRFKAHMFTAADTLDKAREEGQGPTSPLNQSRREANEPTSIVDQIYANILKAQAAPEARVNIREELNLYLREPVIDRKSGLSLE